MEGIDIGRSVQILSRLIKRRLDKVVYKYNVTSVQCSFINFISRSSKKGDVYAKDIEKKFNMRRATVAEILGLMEKNQLIKRIHSGTDARLKKIVLTEKSLEIEKSLKKELKNVEKSLRQGLTTDEVKQFMKTVNQMSVNLEN